LLRNRSVCFGCFDIGSKHRNKPNLFLFGFTKQPKQTRNRSCFGLFRFEPKFIFVCFEDTLVSPSHNSTVQHSNKFASSVSRSAFISLVSCLLSCIFFSLYLFFLSLSSCRLSLAMYVLCIVSHVMHCFSCNLSHFCFLSFSHLLSGIW
jgi:hypothetical protein